ncbi:MAG: rRNA maturation RNase YbeY [Mycoplasma sp.]|nr:rRNA maturation RNase YbeY [Mycoplasma sp.]
MTNLNIVNEFKEIDNLEFLNELANDLITSGLRKNKDYSLSLIFINNNEIHELNKKYRNKDKPTDVLSFSSDWQSMSIDLPEIELGDIYISKEKILEQSQNYNHSIKREVSYLFLHGLLHLFGYDHLTEPEEKNMNQLVNQTLNKYNIGRD